MKTLLSTSVVFFSTIAFLGCGDSLPLSSFKARQVQRAPQSHSETGVVISGASEKEMAQLLENKPNTKFRTINKNHGLYEVYGVSSKELTLEMPHLSSMKNEFLNMEILKNNNELSNNTVDRFFTLNSSPDSVEKLNPCLQSQETPSTDLSINSKLIVEENINIIVETGTSLSFDGSASKPHVNVGDSVRVAFAMQPPADSLIGEQVSFSPVFNLTPDSMGLYKVVMVVQDKNNVCAYKGVALTVTANPELEEIQSGASDSLVPFKHLVELQAEKSWKISTGTDVTIAIIDTGVNYNHPDLNKNILVNKDEVPGNGVDDDNNGFIDDAYGYDFSNSDEFPYDDVGHGTHVAGLAAASTFGLAKNAKILPVKSMSPAGGDLGSILGAILYAVDNGANVLNMSLGAYSQAPHPELVRVMNYAESKGVLVVAASGNGHPQLGIGMNTDSVPNYPSALPNDNIIAVAAKDSSNLLAPYSNYGQVSVDVTAPGGSGPNDLVVSSYYENPSKVLYLGLVGTSMASPIVAGIAAQVWALNPEMTALDVKNVLLNTGEKVQGLDTRTVSGRYINAFQAVNAVKIRTPN